MINRLTKEIVNERISSRNLILVGEYINANTKTRFKCRCEYEWETTPGNIMCGKGCPKCANRIKLTRQMFEERIKHTGISLVGDYIDTQTKTSFRCYCGNIWEAKPSKITGVKGCPKCATKNGANKIRLSEPEINGRINDRGIYLIDGFIKVREKAKFKCNCGHIWMATPDSIIRGNGCPRCSDTKLSKNIINQRLIDRKISLIGDYVNYETKTEFSGGCGHTWWALPGNVMAGRGCPSCAYSGFEPSKAAWVYILYFNSFIKYGITNNLPRRLKEHRKNGKYILVFSKKYEDGSIAQNWERDIKNVFGGRFAKKEIIPDGWTETLPPDKLQLLIETIK